MKIIANDYEPKEIIKMIREWSHQTQEEFGATIHRSKHNIQSMELGRNNIYFHTLLEIAEKYDLIISIEKQQH